MVRRSRSQSSNLGGKYYGTTYMSGFQLKKIYQVGLTDIDVEKIINYGQPNIDLGDYIYRASVAGVPASKFVNIASSGILAKAPDITSLKNYYHTLPELPVLPMLAYRVGIKWQEIKEMKDNPDFTEKNLRAMLDLQ